MPSSAGSTGPTPSRLPALILLLGSITAVGPLSIDLYLPAFPELARQLETSESAIQLSLTACLIGLALGQAVNGPLSDRIGRRLPLLVGMSGYTVASVLCAVAPSVTVLTGARFLQGVTGAAGIVVAQALVRDVVSGPQVARLLSRLMLVSGVAPILAPTLGGQLLRFTGWRGIFVVLAVFGAVMVVVIALFLRETLPAERRHAGGAGEVLSSYAAVLRDRRFVAYVLTCGLGFAVIFGYVSGSPFAYQEVHGLSPQQFGLLFGLNSVGFVLSSQLNARLVLRHEPIRLLRRGVPVTAAAAVLLVLTTTTGAFGVVGLAVPLFFVMSSLGLVIPNAAALALNRQPKRAGTAAALVGMSQSVVGAVAGPLVGIGGSDSAVAMGVVIAAGGFGALGLVVLVSRRETRSRRLSGAVVERLDGPVLAGDPEEIVADIPRQAGTSVEAAAAYESRR